MARRSAAQTRQLLIDTAVAMLHEEGPAAGVMHIRLSEVVNRAGLTTGAAYRLWNDQRDFHDDLAIAALQWRDRSLMSKTLHAIAPVLQAGGTLEQVIRAGAEANLQRLPDDVGIVITLALRASAYNHPELRKAAAERQKDTGSSFSELYGEMMHSYGRRMKMPFTLEHLVASFTALVEGFGVQAAAGEEHPWVVLQEPDPAAGVRTTLLGVCLLALIDVLTEPAKPANPGAAPDDGGQQGAGR